MLLVGFNAFITYLNGVVALNFSKSFRVSVSEKTAIIFFSLSETDTDKYEKLSICLHTRYIGSRLKAR